MGYMRRPRHPTGRPRKPDGRCPRHPKHQQSPGVCSLCLREKLSLLSSSSSSSSASRKRPSSSSSSSLSPYESLSSDSSTSSSVNQYRTEKAGSGLFRRNNSVLLMKSRSVPLVRSQKGKDEGESNGKAGFWSKLFPGRGRKTGSGEGLEHSKTVRER